MSGRRLERDRLRRTCGGIPVLARQLKEKLRRSEPSIGAWMTLAHPSIAEILSRAGFEWVVIDMEHSAISVSEVLRLIIAVENGGSIPLVRLAGMDPLQCKAVLDSGAAGVLIPSINTPAEAEAAVRMAKYPPRGLRGVGLARAQGYGEQFPEYIAQADTDSLVIVQIEHIEGVKNIEEILAVPGIDGTFIGPYDLSMSLGIPGQLAHPEVTKAKKRVLEATLAHGLSAGIHLVHPRTAVADSRAAIQEGYTFLAHGTDMLILVESARALAIGTPAGGD